MSPNRAAPGLSVLVVMLAAIAVPILAAVPSARAGTANVLVCKRTCIDLDGDCLSKSGDALVSLRANVGLYVAFVSGIPKLLDANRDGKVSVRDTLLLLHRVVGSSPELPCEVPVNPTSTTTSTT